MSQGEVLDWTRQAIWTACLIGLPILVLSLVVGVAVSVFQAMTQIQEATLSFVPKILGVFLVLALFGPWMMNTMLTFTSNLLTSLPSLTR